MKTSKGTSAMANWTLCRTAALLACPTLLVAVASEFAVAAQRVPELAPAAGVKVVASEFGSNFVPLGVGKSVVVDLPHDVRDVLVADPKIANAVIRTTRRAYLIGVSMGQTNIYFFDAEGRQLAGFDIAVTRDLNGMRGALKQMFPRGNVRVEAISDGVMLTGTVSTPIEAQQAFDIAGHLVGDNNKVVNGIVVRGRDQVMLKVTVAEVQRNVIKQLGVDLSGSAGIGSAVVSFNNTNPFSVNPGPLSASNIAGSFKSVTATLRAMEQAGVVRTLAEPTLTAISGESASFLAGGEFPIPPATVAPGATPQPPTFKKFGVLLNFKPVVMSEGRISLNVQTEVSEIDNTIAVNGVPGVKTRRADTTVEIPSGGSLAMAGMIREQTKQNINGLPGLMQVPMLGTLFKSRDYVNNQTELVILVTPSFHRSAWPVKPPVWNRGFGRPDRSVAFLSRQLRLHPRLTGAARR